MNLALKAQADRCMRVTVDNLDEVAQWTGGNVLYQSVVGIPGSLAGLVFLRAHVGQWVHRRPDGLFYVRDVFTP